MSMSEMWWLVITLALLGTVTAVSGALFSLGVAFLSHRIAIRWQPRSTQDARSWIITALVVPATAYVAATTLGFALELKDPRRWFLILVGLLVIEVVAVLGMFKLRPNQKIAGWRTWNSQRLLAEFSPETVQDVPLIRIRLWTTAVLDEGHASRREQEGFPDGMRAMMEANRWAPPPGLSSAHFWRGSGVYGTFTARHVWAHAKRWEWTSVIVAVLLVLVVVPWNIEAILFSLALLSILMPVLHQGIRGRFIYDLRKAYVTEQTAEEALSLLTLHRRTPYRRRLGRSRAPLRVTRTLRRRRIQEARDPAPDLRRG